MHPARLVIVSGLPGSGKTTTAVELCERFAAIRMSADDWMEALSIDLWDAEVRAAIERTQRDLTGELLAVGTSVVVEWGSWARSERDDLLELARSVGAGAHLVFLDPPIDVLWPRVRDRAREQRFGSRAITRDDLVEWSAIIQRPTATEFADYDPLPPVTAGEQPGSPAFPYGGWHP